MNSYANLKLETRHGTGPIMFFIMYQIGIKCSNFYEERNQVLFK